MNNAIINRFDYKFFAYFCLIWVTLGWVGFLLTLGSIFYTIIIAAVFLCLLSIFFYFSFKEKLFNKISKEFILIVILSILIVFIFSQFSTPSIFSGRDQGAISESGIRLAQNHQLEFSTPASMQFFKIYGHGRALNFPGFYYETDGMLKTQFPLVYIAWLAIFYSFFGLGGLILANAILLLIFLLSMYLLARIFLNAPLSIIFLLITATSFTVFWFFKFTLSENMALALVWPAILYLILLVRDRDCFYYWAIFLTAGLAIFSRIEDIAFFAIFIIFAFFNKNIRTYIFENKFTRLIIPLIILTVVAILNFFVDINFYKELAKAVIKPASDNPIQSPSHTLEIFLIYGLLPYFILGIVGIIYFVKNKKKYALIPLLIILPSILYIFNSFISPDHPWMLRRYAFTIVPAALFYSILFIAEWLKNRKVFTYIAVIALLILNLTVFYRFAFFSENTGLLEQTGTLAQKFSNNDLILVDQLASGNKWSMISGPLSFIFGKNSIYFFNADDLPKLDQKMFDNIYLIVPDENIGFYKQSRLWQNMEYWDNYSLQTARLDVVEENNNSAVRLPKITNSKINGTIFKIKL